MARVEVRMLMGVRRAFWEVSWRETWDAVWDELNANLECCDQPVNEPHRTFIVPR